MGFEMKISWQDGLHMIPGIGRARQILSAFEHWSTTIWITEDGQPYRRLQNAATGSVAWKSISPTLRQDNLHKSACLNTTLGKISEHASVS